MFSRFVNSKESVLFVEVRNLQAFRVFDFGSYTKIESSENSEMFSRLINLEGFVFFEEV